MKILGIDEARRGPVIGPMVIAGTMFDESKLSELKKIGVKDSKLLTPAQREAMFDKILKLADGHKEIIVLPDEMDARASVGLNINLLEAQKAAEIIDALKPDIVFVDSPTSPKAEKFADYIKATLKNKDVDIHAEHKCDVNHPECSAASVIAKVTGDREVEKIRKEIGLEFGSGYMSDEVTQKFVQEHWENKLSKYIRHSWAPIKQLKSKKFQKFLEVD